MSRGKHLCSFFLLERDNGERDNGDSPNAIKLRIFSVNHFVKRGRSVPFFTWSIYKSKRITREIGRPGAYQ